MYKFLALILFVFLFFPTSANAHVVKSENSIGAVLHVDPEDDPIASEQSTLFLEFKDTEDKFNLNDCDCKVIILQNEREIISQNFGAVSETETLSAAIPVTFPEKSIYQLKVIGSPKTESDFSNFELDFEVRVARENLGAPPVPAEPSWTEKHLVKIIGFAILVFLVAGILINRRLKK